MSTAHLGALHLKGRQLQAVGLLLEGRPEVKVYGPHPEVPPNSFDDQMFYMQSNRSGRLDFKQQSFKEGTRSTDN